MKELTFFKGYQQEDKKRVAFNRLAVKTFTPKKAGKNILRENLEKKMTTETWEALFIEFESSGLTQKAFCCR